jgi:demethylmenaquinone methyltransferase/2-methoxy-6-polyprenyl-1,4-benzoquinol methylase
MVKAMNSAGSSDSGTGTGTTFFGDRTVPLGEKQRLVRDVFRSVAGRYDLMNDLMSGGIHRLWKTQMVNWLNPQGPMDIVDVAGGTGDIAFRMWKRLNTSVSGANPDSTITVCDLTEDMVRVGRDRALDHGIMDGIKWVTGDAQFLPLADESQDAYTIAFGIRNVTDLNAALEEARRVLRWGGRFLCLEFSSPVVAGLGTAYRAYSATLPWLGQVVTGDGDAYRYLIESIAKFPSRNNFAQRIEAAGFSAVSTRPLSGGIAALHSAWRT